MSRRKELVFLVVILVVAIFFRIYRLDSVPPGMTHDEADVGYFVKAVYSGGRAQIHTPYGYANEPFAMYSGAAFMALFGPTDLALRLHSAFFNTLTLVALYLWARMAFGPGVALGAAGLMAVTFWPVLTARQALNFEPAATLFVGSVACLWYAWFDSDLDAPPRKRWWAWLLAAVLLGGSVWSYEVARATAPVIAALGVYVFFRDRHRFQWARWWFVGTVALGYALAAPHVLDPDAWQRASTLATTLRELQAGNPGPIISTTMEALGAFAYKGDPFITYNIPDRPIFGPLVAALFFAGVLVAAWRWKQTSYALLILWLLFGLAPAMIVGVWNFTSHAIGMQAAAFVPPALAALELVQLLRKRFGRWAGNLAIGLFVLLVLSVGLITFQDYFLDWGGSPEVAGAYFADLAAATSYLDERSPAGVAVLSSPHPDLPHDPFIADLRVRRSDVDIRWFDGRNALLMPDVQEARLVILDGAPLPPDLVPSSLVVADAGPGYTVFSWNPRAERDRWVAAGSPIPEGVGNLGGVQLTAARFPPSAAPGGLLTVVTMWQVMDPAALGPVPSTAYGRSAAILVHLLDQAGELVAQKDRLDVPAWDWRPGDFFVQLHQVELPLELAEGHCHLVAGVYSRPDILRLAGPAGADSIDLGSVEVAAP